MKIDDDTRRDRPGAGDLLSKLQDGANGTSPGGQPPRERLEPPRHTPSPATLRPRLVVAVGLSLLVVLLATVWSSLSVGPWLQLLLTTPVVAWCAWPIHRVAWTGLRRLAPGLDVPVSLGMVAAYAYSTVRLISGATDLLFEVAALAAAIHLAGRYVEGRGVDAARAPIDRLLAVGVPDVAILRIDPRTRTTSESRVPVADLAVGDQFVVRPGETVAADGVVLDGSSVVDRGLLGEPAIGDDAVAIGDRVLAGSLNTTARIVVEAMHVGGGTVLARSQRLIQSAQEDGSNRQRLARRIATWLVVGVPVLAVATLVGWLVTGHGATRSWSVALAVLLVASPMALVLAAPAALLAGIGRGVENAVLVRGATAIDALARSDTVVLDTGGMLTTGLLELKSIAVRGRLTKKAALTAAAAVEQGNEHPVARAIVAGAHLARIDLPRIRDFEANPAEGGASARIKDTEVTVGRATLFETVDESLRAHAAEHAGTTVHVGWGGVGRAALTVEDTVLESSERSVRRLRRLGLMPYLVTCDDEASATHVAAQVGIDPGKVRSGVPSALRRRVVGDLRRPGNVVAVVGTCADDAAALAEGHVGIALGAASGSASGSASGTVLDAAADSVGIVLLRPGLDAVGDAVELSRATATVVRQNLGFAYAYHVVALALAAFGLVSPVAAAGAAVLASLAVVANALRLRRRHASTR